jgi:hypothetical protein
MARVNAFPYLRASLNRIQNTVWLQLTDRGERPLPGLLPHWDPGMPLLIRITMDVDVEGIWADCKLAPDDILRIAILWYSPGTGLRGQGSIIDLPKANSIRSTMLEFNIEGILLSDKVRFELQLVLAFHGKMRDQFKLAAKRPGSILWREEKVVILEGQGTRFPTELVNFADTQWLPQNAGWFLDWDPKTLDESVLGNLRLFLNTENEPVRRSAVESLQADQPIRDIIMFDVGRALISGALENDDFIQYAGDYEDGSVGASVRRLLRALFPNESIEGIAQRYHHSRSRFECDLQDHFRLFKEV